MTNIYFWDYEKLARNLKGGGLSEYQKFIYFLLFIILPYISDAWDTVLRLNLQESPSDTFDVRHPLTGVLSGLLLMGMIYILYKTNKKGDNVHFLERYICIWLPCLIQSIALAFAVMIICTLFGTHTSDIHHDIETIVVVSLCSFYFLSLMHKGFKIASGQIE